MPPLKRARTSECWDYAADRDENGDLPVNAANRRVWRCQPCLNRGRIKEMKHSSGTAAFSEHLRSKHGIEISTSVEQKRLQDAEGSRKITEMGGFKVALRTGEHGSAVAPQTIEAGVLRLLFIELLAGDNLPYTLAESPRLRRLFNYMNISANRMLPRSANTIKTDLQWSVDVRHAAIRDAFTKAKSKVHLVCDAWTSPNGYAIWGVVAVFLDSRYRLQNLTIGLKRLRGDHRGATQAAITLEVAQKYGIEKNLGYMVIDNATSNDTLIDAMELALKEQEIDWDSQQHRMRCFGHIINLSASVFIYGNVKSEDVPAEDASAEWRRFRALSKLHNIIIYIQRSPQRGEAFRELSEGLKLQRDNRTRWNSWFKSIERALKPEVKRALLAYYDEQQELRAKRLSPGDWDTLTEMQDFLRPFYDATKGVEGVFDAVDKVLPAIEFLLEHLEASRQKYDSNGYIGKRVDKAWSKIQEYYNASDATVAYAGATALNPLYKWTWFEKRWDTKELLRGLRKAQKALKELWISDYKHFEAPISSINQSRPITSAKRDPNSLITCIAQDLEQQNTLDELEVYLSERTLWATNPYKFSALKWWTEESQRLRFPNLSRLAIDLLTIPAMSAEIERVFSECKLTCLRSAILPESLETIHVLRSWLRSTALEGIQLVNTRSLTKQSTNNIQPTKLPVDSTEPQTISGDDEVEEELSG